ncbi:MAG: ABC transporter substrate-binding protein [Betaproteobacteria bacterium]|nr:ABC transporter substrate-binding protein [Betaproteobacteria bacterium]
MSNQDASARPLRRFRIDIARISWRDLAVTLGPFLLVSVLAFWIAYRFVRPAPPDTITMTSGPEGSTFRNSAERYRRILARNGVKLEILPSEGSLENLRRLSDPDAKVDVGFVQAGLANLAEADELMSLGSVSYQPLSIFYRSPKPLGRLSELRGKRIAIGPEGSGTRVLAQTLLKANGIEAPGPTKLLDLGGKAAVQAILRNQADAVFLMGDSAAPASTRELLRTRGIRLFDFTQGDAYVRRFRYLAKIELPPGSLDLGRNTPARPLTMVAPNVELLARSDLHPALSDMLIEAAREVHGRATLLQKAREFPAPLEHEYRISDDAARYYRSGKGFTYNYLPFWLASLVDRILVMLVPIVVLLIPGVRLLPFLYRWRISSRIYRRYGVLMALERAALAQPTAEEREQLLKRLDEIEKSVIASKLPGSFADQVYVLRHHINFVRAQISGSGAASALPPLHRQSHA